MGTDQRGISGKYFNKPKVIAQLELVTTFATYCSRWFQTFSKILQKFYTDENQIFFLLATIFIACMQKNIYTYEKSNAVLLLTKERNAQI